MSHITKEELVHLNGLFDAVVHAAIDIKGKAPNCNGECEAIERHGQHAYALLNEIQKRNSN